MRTLILTPILMQGVAQQDRGQYGGQNIHFICFSEREGLVYELDGLKAAPTAHGPCEENKLLEHSVRVMQEKFKSNPHQPMQMMALSKV